VWLVLWALLCSPPLWAQQAAAKGLPSLAEMGQAVAKQLPAHLALVDVQLEDVKQEGNAFLQMMSGQLAVNTRLKEDLFQARGTQDGKMRLYRTAAAGSTLTLKAMLIAMVPAGNLGGAERSVNVTLLPSGDKQSGQPLSFFPAGGYVTLGDAPPEAPETPRVAAKPAPPPAPSAEGHWSGRFESAEVRGGSMELSLWKTPAGRWAGVSRYANGCEGYFGERSATPLPLLEEVLVGGGECGASAATLTLQMARPAYIVVVWQDTAQTRTWSSSMRSVKAAGADLQRLIDAYRHDETAAKKAAAARVAALAEAARAAQAASARVLELDKRGYHAPFPSGKLLGAWRGSITDAAGAYPAELALWPAQRWGLHKATGQLAFTEPFCATALLINSQDSAIDFSTTTHGARPEARSCVRGQQPRAFGQRGRFELSPDGKTLFMFFTLGPNFDTRHEPRCVAGLTRTGCFAVGVFTRARVSPELLAVARTGYPDVPNSGPPAEWLTLLSAGTAPGVALQTSHNQAEAENAAVVARRREAEERKRDEAAQRTRAEYQAKRLRESGGRPGQPNPESQRGPLDGLPGAVYLNAIYHGDFVEVRRQDYEFALAMQRAPAEFARKPDTRTELEGDYKRASMSVAVLQNYLYGYGKRYAKCLRPDAHLMTVTTSTDRVTTKQFFSVTVTEREKGAYTSSEGYPMNAEFADIFTRIYQRGSGLGGLMASMVNKGSLGDVERGTDAMMRKFACDSPVIQTMEKNLIGLYQLINTP